MRHIARQVDGEWEFAEGWSASKSKGEARKRAARSQQCQRSPIPNTRAEFLGWIWPFWEGHLAATPASPGRSAPSPSNPTASLPLTATPQGGETPPASPRWPFPCLPQLFLAAPRSPHSPAHQQMAPELLSPCKPSLQGKMLGQETTQSP